MNKCIFFLFALFFPLLSWADSYSCPGNFKTVQTGDTMQAVIAACGAPLTQVKEKRAFASNVEMARWTYHLGDGLSSGVQPMSAYWMHLTIIFHDRKVVQAEKNERVGAVYGLGAAICRTGAQIQLGETMDQVLAACGAPDNTMVRHMQMNILKPVTFLTYSNGAYSPPTTLEFDENGIMIAVKR